MIDLLSRLSIASYLLAFAIVTVFALAYLSRSEFMPYHRIATGRSWAQIEPGVQLLILALIRVVGAAWLAAALAGFLLTYQLLYRPGTLLGLVCFQIFCLLATVPPVVIAAHVRRRTGAPTPIRSGLGVIGLSVLGFVLALASGRYA